MSLVPADHGLSITVYLSFVADHVHPFMTTMDHLLIDISCRMMHHDHLKLVSGTVSSLYSSELRELSLNLRLVESLFISPLNGATFVRYMYKREEQ